jgi:hypothetical protein
MNFESKKADDDGVKVFVFLFLFLIDTSRKRKAKRTMGFVAFVVRSREPSGNESQN